jgi:hypothetical protein
MVKTAAGLMGIIGILAIGGCGGQDTAPDIAAAPNGGAGATTTPAATGTTDPEDAIRAHTACLREHGVDVDEQAGGFVAVGDAGDPKVREAMKACEPLLAGVIHEPTAAEQEAMREDLLAYARCMREHGVDMPDPVFDGEGGVRVGNPGDGLDPAAMEKANETCANEVGGAGFLGVTVGPGETP